MRLSHPLSHSGSKEAFRLASEAQMRNLLHANPDQNLYAEQYQKFPPILRRAPRDTQSGPGALTEARTNSGRHSADQSNHKLEELFESHLNEKAAQEQDAGDARNDESERVDRMEELQKRKDREGGEHLEMMIKQTERGPRKPKTAIERRYIEDKVHIVDSIRRGRGAELKPSELFKRVKESSPEPSKKPVEKVSLINIKMDEPEEAQEPRAEEQEPKEGELGKRDFKSFENEKGKNEYAKMFESDNEDEESQKSDENGKDFLQKEKERKERERILEEKKANQKMEKTVNELLQKDKKQQESEEEVDEKEEEPLNSQDDISGRLTRRGERDRNQRPAAGLL